MKGRDRYVTMIPSRLCQAALNLAAAGDLFRDFDGAIYVAAIADATFEDHVGSNSRNRYLRGIDIVGRGQCLFDDRLQRRRTASDVAATLIVAVWKLLQFRDLPMFPRCLIALDLCNPITSDRSFRCIDPVRC